MAKAALIRRLRMYWQVEAGNVVMVPGVAMAAVHIYGGKIGWPTILAASACAALLVIGALAWRMELANVQGKPQVAQYWTPILARLQAPMLLLSLSACGAVVWRLATWADLWSPDAIAAAVLATLAALEYVNYYHVQLQHFDNAADFKRLVSGKGFRRAHLARAIDAWKAKR
jgi:hypothetical protein